ncbi:hypothetical protein PG987_014046 [Apiospora arundinis]
MAPEGPPTTAAIWMNEWRRIWTDASQKPQLLSELFYEETSNGKKAVSGSNFKAHHALALRPVWVCDEEKSFEHATDMLRNLNLITQNDVDAVKAFMKATEPSTNLNLKNERRAFAIKLDQLADQTAHTASRENNQLSTEVCEESREAISMFRAGSFQAGSNSIPFADAYEKKGLTLLRFLEVINEGRTLDRATALGWDKKMTMDAFLGGFRASVGHYVQIVTSPPPPPPRPIARGKSKAIKRPLQKPLDTTVEDETIVTVFFSGLVNNVQSRMSDCARNSNVGNLLGNTRDSWQTRPTRRSFRFGLETKECIKDLKFAGYNTDVDGYVTMRGTQDRLEPTDKLHLPLMIEVKAAGWNSSVWRQLTAEMAGWIYQTAKPHPTQNARSGVTQHRIMLTQHGLQIYMILASFGDRYLEYIHRVRSGQGGEVVTTELEERIEAYENKKKKLNLDPAKDGLPYTHDELQNLKGDMLNMTRFGPWEVHRNSHITDFAFLLMFVLQAKRREYTAREASKKHRK